MGSTPLALGARDVPPDIAEDARYIGADPDTRKRAELARKVAAMDPPTRAAAAVNMAIEGSSYYDIARVLDYPSPSAAKKAVWAAIGDIEPDPDEVKRQRHMMSQTLGRLQASMMRRATNPKDPDHVQYVRATIAVLDREAKLLGLDAPTNIVLHSATAQEIDDYVAQVQQLKVIAAGDVEADILEDVVDAEIEDES